MSAWLFRWLGALPLRWIVSSLLAASLFGAGYLQGHQDVQKAWDVQRQQQQAAVLAQSLHVAQIETQQEHINQQISTDYETQKATLARRVPVPVPGAGALRLCVPASHAADSVPANAKLASSAVASTANPVPDPARDAGAIGCGQLARDAADATLMVLSFQRWYAEQAKAQADTAEP
ncbi:hypothetical protein [Limnohabitans sp.]|uniref:hypothetical protein n=1 Tax=Limnohabitans sp. TaxID=1907725 RepID=UPI00311ED18C